MTPRLPCPAPDVYPGIPHDVYRSWDAVCQSDLKSMRPTPNLLPYRRANPKPPSDEMILGSAFHTHYLDGWEAFNKEYAVVPEGLNLATKAGIAWKENELKGRTRLSWQDHKNVLAMVDSLINRCPHVDAIMNCHGANPKTQNEVSIVWDDAATGLRCKGRLDAIRPDGNAWIIVDAKSCRNASPKGFADAANDKGYDIQEAFYRWGCASLGLEISRFVFAAVESSGPYNAAPYELDDDFRLLGWQEVRRLLDLYAECERTQTWPGYSPEPVTISPPAWRMKGR